MNKITKATLVSLLVLTSSLASSGAYAQSLGSPQVESASSSSSTVEEDEEYAELLDSEVPVELEEEAVGSALLPESSNFPGIVSVPVQAYAAGSKKVYRCTLNPGNPHLSEGEAKKKRNSVVAKVKVTCPNANKDLKVSIYAVLAEAPTNTVSALKIVDSNSGTFKVKDGKTATVMVPAPSSNNHHKAGKGSYWRMAVSAKIVGESSVAPINAGKSSMKWLVDRKF